MRFRRIFQYHRGSGANLAVMAFAVLGLCSLGPPGEEAWAQGAPKAGEDPWLHYDFFPASSVLFFEDFTRDKVGNFPRRLEFLKGNMEVAEWQGARWLRASARSDFAITLPEELPERFTMELEYFSGSNNVPLKISFTDDAKRPYVLFTAIRSGIQGGAPRVYAVTRTANTGKLREQAYNARIMADGDYVKVYANEQRTANVPNAPLGRSNKITIHMPGTNSNPVMLKSIRIAAGGKRIYDELIEAGRVITRGILFDTNSERLRPESTPTLKQIGEMLREHPDLTLVIEGHTDDVGDEAANLVLSERRAESVRRFLIVSYGIDENRLVSKGYGEARPVDANDTPEGQQNNRRVELVRP